MLFYLTFKSRYFIAMAAIALMSSTAPADADSWELIGQDPLSDDTEIFIRRDALEDLGDSSFYVVTLTVHPATVRGIDQPRSNGETYYDTNYPHRSYVEISVYDCQRRMTALG
jgi:hypothetical protein